MNATKMKKSIQNNGRLWIALWTLMAINIYIILEFIRGFSMLGLIIFLFLVVGGFLYIKRVHDIPYQSSNNRKLVDEHLNQLMEEVKPYCEEVFEREIERITVPVVNGVRDDFNTGLQWLWRDSEEYLQQVEESISDTRELIQMVNSMNGDTMPYVKRLRQDLLTVENALDMLRDGREKDEDDMEQCLKLKTDELSGGMEREKEIFYDYIYKSLLQQMNSRGMDEDEYFNIERLGEHFAVVIERSVQARLDLFSDSLIDDVENISANIVGKVQHGCLQLMNAFADIAEVLDFLINNYPGNTKVQDVRMPELRRLFDELKEKASDIMRSLAWQDILIEKRWQDLRKLLFSVKDKVIANVDDDVIDYLRGELDKEISGFDSMRKERSTALMAYRAVIDAELIYRIFEGNKLPEIIEDGVYALLQFMRPVELLASSQLRLSAKNDQLRRSIREDVRNARYNDIWDRVVEKLAERNMELLLYLEDAYPRSFYAFCNSPYLRDKPQNLNQAAWYIFLDLIQQKNNDDESYVLVGLLIVMHRLRNKYIHPLKNSPLPLENLHEIELMRYCAFRSIEILQ